MGLTTKRHFEKIAEILGKEGYAFVDRRADQEDIRAVNLANSTVDSIIDGFVEWFRRDNDLFDEDLFDRAVYEQAFPGKCYDHTFQTGSFHPIKEAL